MTYEESARLTGLLSEAILTKDWAAARLYWDVLSLHHESLIKNDPYFMHVATVLRNQHAMLLMAERQSTAIH